jgi:hypothetical protein
MIGRRATVAELSLTGRQPQRDIADIGRSASCD